MYAVVLVNVHALVFWCICRDAGECTNWLSGVYTVVQVNVHVLVVRCVCHGAGECACVGCQVSMPWGW